MLHGDAKGFNGESDGSIHGGHTVRAREVLLRVPGMLVCPQIWKLCGSMDCFLPLAKLRGPLDLFRNHTFMVSVSNHMMLLYTSQVQPPKDSPVV